MGRLNEAVEPRRALGNPQCLQSFLVPHGLGANGPRDPRAEEADDESIATALVDRGPAAMAVDRGTAVRDMTREAALGMVRPVEAEFVSQRRGYPSGRSAASPNLFGPRWKRAPQPDNDPAIALAA